MHRTPTRTLVIVLLPTLLLITAAGCPPHHKPEEEPLPGRHLSSRLDLMPNVGETVLIDGTAHYQRLAGPSVAVDDFQVRVYPTSAWGAEMEGKRVQVSGRLEASTHATPPDPSVTPGEYWLADSQWRPAPAADAKK